MQITTRRLRLAPALAAACIALCAAGTPRAGLQALEWAPATNGSDVTWADGDRYCAALVDQGHDDWRLPTLTELERMYATDPADAARLVQATCCLWSSTTLAELPDPSGSATGAAPAQYYWGLLLDGGIRYYSNRVFTDGQALCVRTPAGAAHQ